MAQLAIKGHETRGKEVIEILEMLGGKILRDRLAGNELFSWYYINGNGYIDYKHYSLFDDTMVFTLEAFIEKYPYKVGDKVLINDDENDVHTIASMTWNDDLDRIAYQIKAIDGILDDYVWFEDEMIPYKSQESIPPYMDYDVRTIKKEPMEEERVYTTLDFNYEPAANKVELILGDYEIKEENGKTYLIKKFKYPKTYEECCAIVNASPYVNLVYNLADGQNYSYDADNLHVYENLRRLIICRDAYWKVVGEQMGLDKPWKPDFLNRTNEIRYFIFCTGITIEKGQSLFPSNKVLIFPSEEMCNAFYENFKDLIELCKELL